MNFDDLEDKELNPAFLSWSNVAVKPANNYLSGKGTQGVLEVKAISYHTGHKGQSYIVEFEVVEASGEGAHKPGERVTWMKKIGDGEKNVDTKRKYLLTGLARIAGLTSCPPDQVSAFLTKCSSADQPLTGYRVAYAFPEGWEVFKSIPWENTPEKLAERRGQKA